MPGLNNGGISNRSLVVDEDWRSGPPSSKEDVSVENSNNTSSSTKPTLHHSHSFSVKQSASQQQFHTPQTTQRHMPNRSYSSTNLDHHRPNPSLIRLSSNPNFNAGSIRQIEFTSGLYGKLSPAIPGNASDNTLRQHATVATLQNETEMCLEDDAEDDVGTPTGSSSSLKMNTRHMPPAPIDTQVANSAALSNPDPNSTSFQRQISSMKRQSVIEPKTPAEYALHIVFTQFVRHAERKLSICLQYPPNVEPDITKILGEGADPSFDRILVSLGYIARRKPAPIIDSVMMWRKSKSEPKTSKHSNRPSSFSQGHSSKALKSGASLSEFRRRSSSQSSNVPSDSSERDQTVLSNRRILVSIYLLCRVLLEVVKQSLPEMMDEDLSEKIEEMVFKQLRLADPEVISGSTIRRANWNLFASLLGEMSVTRFSSVSDHFIEALEKTTGTVPKEKEVHIQMLIHSMKYLQIRFYPMDALEESADFLESLCKFFALSHGQRIKQAYCEVLTVLLLPIAGKITAEVNHPTWMSAIEMLYPKGLTMVGKQRYWATAYSLLCTTLCVAPHDFFASNWISLVETHASKLKDRSSRSVYLVGFSRLVWVYMFRNTESLNNTIKKLDTLLKILLPTTKRGAWFSTPEPDIVNPFVQLIRFIGANHLEYTFQNVILPMLNGDSLGPSSMVPLSSDVLNPEKMIVGMRSFLCILSDISKIGEKPEFPVSFDMKLKMDPDFLASVKPGTTLAEYVNLFSQIVGKIAVACDSSFGSHTTLDEQLLSITPKSAVSATFSFSTDPMTQVQRHHYYALLACIFEAIAVCPPSNIAFPNLVEMLCRSTLHIGENVAESAKDALRTLALVRNTQVVVNVFAKFVFGSDSRYLSVAEGGSLNSSRTEANLKVFVDLLHIWISVIRKKTTDELESKAQRDENTSEIPKSDISLSGVWTVIEEVEGCGLFFLCSQDRVVRKLAISILSSVVEFDQALREYSEVTNNSGSVAKATQYSGLIHVFESPEALNILQFDGAEVLSVAERTRLNKLQLGKRKDILLRLAESDYGVDSALWLKVFPKVISVCFNQFPMPVALCRDDVCTRLVQMHETVVAAAEAYRGHLGSNDYVVKHPMRTDVEILIEQWKLYLIVACCIVTSTDQPPSPNSSSMKSFLNHSRKKSTQKVTPQKLSSAKGVFRLIIPLLRVEHPLIREAAVTGLSHININLYKTLIQELLTAVHSPDDILRTGKFHQRSTSFGRRSYKQHDRLLTEATRLLQLTSHFLHDESVYNDEWVLSSLTGYVKDAKSFLAEPEIQEDWDYQRLRQYFCGLLESLYEGLIHSGNASKWLPFEGRMACFTLLEEWCGHSSNVSEAKERESRMQRSFFDHYKDGRDTGVLAASMEIERRNLELAALSSMSSLCNGPISETIGDARTGPAYMSFDADRLFVWLDSVFSSTSDKMHSIGQRSLRNLLLSNPDSPELMQKAIAKCYADSREPKATKSYFSVVSEVLTEVVDYPCEKRQPIALGLFKVGDEDQLTRARAAKLLRATEMRFYGCDSCLQDSEIGITDRTTAVYKRAQFDMSTLFANTHAEETFMVFSELTMFFHVVSAKSRRDILAVLLPWVQNVELQLDANGEDPSPSATMVMNNLFEITVRFSDIMQNEVEALWVALGSGRHPGNVKAVLDFIISNSIIRRDPLFVEYGKQIIVHLMTTPSGPKLVEALIAYLQPRSMVPQHRDPPPVGPNDLEVRYPYAVDLSTVLPKPAKRFSLSYGQLGMILLVDLLVKPDPIMASNLPLLIHVVMILMDHYILIVREQAREMLIHLIHEIVIVDGRRSPEASEFVDLLRRKDQKTLWHYDDLSSEKNGGRTPRQMDQMVRKVVEIFSTSHPDIRAEWSSTALTWATTCPVRHLACRSFQLFRSLLTFVSETMLADMLARLSNTIADSSPDIQGFSMQILMTLNAITEELDLSELIKHPQLFWVTVASLGTIHEQEFIELLAVLERILEKVDLQNPEIVARFLGAFPAKWEGRFEGLQQAVLPGLRSSNAYHLTMRVLDKLNTYDNGNSLVSNDDRLRLLYGLMSNLPRFLHALEENVISDELVSAAERLSELAAELDLTALSKIMTSMARSRFRTKNDFLRQTVSVLQNSFFPKYESQTLVFLLSLLSNKFRWMKVETMNALKLVMPLIDMRKDEFAGVGADLISPLLRLLQTDYAEQALSVLDEAVGISGSHMDKHVLRMSLGNRSIRKEYEKTATLFGIPDDSGWSISVPAVKAAMTRSNVHAVFYTCTVSAPENDDSMPPPSPSVRFHTEDHTYSILENRADTMLSQNEDESLSHMWVALDNLDSFFGEEEPERGAMHSRNLSRTDTELSVDPVDSAPMVYDKKVSFILNRSLGRSPSTASFRSSLGESFGTYSLPGYSPVVVQSSTVSPAYDATFNNADLPEHDEQQFGYMPSTQLDTRSTRPLNTSGMHRSSSLKLSSPLSTSSEEEVTRQQQQVNNKHSRRNSWRRPFSNTDNVGHGNRHHNHHNHNHSSSRQPMSPGGSPEEQAKAPSSADSSESSFRFESLLKGATSSIGRTVYRRKSEHRGVSGVSGEVGSSVFNSNRGANSTSNPNGSIIQSENRPNNPSSGGGRVKGQFASRSFGKQQASEVNNHLDTGG